MVSAPELASGNRHEDDEAKRWTNLADMTSLSFIRIFYVYYIISRVVMIKAIQSHLTA
jgi:hypothetical protein